MRRLGLADLREIVTDPTELGKGALLYDERGLEHLARHGDRIYAEARGAMASPYKVTVSLEGKSAQARCSCMAARSRPFCKHAAALLVAWARVPESFAEADVPPIADPPKRRSVKKGKLDTQTLWSRGVEQVGTLVRELAVAGVATLADDREDQVRALGESLRDMRLRRLSGKTIALSGTLAVAAARTGTLDANAYAELVADLLLTARKLEKHLAGEPLLEEHVEELVGKTWTKKDRKPIAGLELVEYAFRAWSTGDDFLVRESRFLELVTGDHYTEKQILPSVIVARTPAKPSWAGLRLVGAAGSLYPGYAPRRIDLADPGERRPLEPGDVVRLLERCLPSVASGLAALQERRRDVFAPERLAIALRAETVLAESGRLRVLDGSGAALFLAAGDELGRVMRQRRLRALLGDLFLDGVLPTLQPLAVVVDDGVLLPLGSELPTDRRPSSTRWVDVARAAGVSAAAIALGEVREEMADALVAGLATAVPRWAEPLGSRLRELGLGKQADLLIALAARPDPAEKLDDFVKLHQVLGIALTRLAGTAPVEVDALVPVPEQPSVRVREAHVGERGDRFEQAVFHERAFAAQPAEALVASPAWNDPALAGFLVRALTRHPAPAIAAATRLLVEGKTDTVKLTAIRVLAALAQRDTLRAFFAHTEEPLLAEHTRLALGLPESLERQRRRTHLAGLALYGTAAAARVQAVKALGEEAFVTAADVVQRLATRDPSVQVRRAAEKVRDRLAP
jgi:SWIM zinc finger